ncbi:MAG: hypothetical protein JXQ75_17570 [Phycisphaerae bacterium]|nr:hypothetical protein [Phycisphaerae bacterium]
MTETASSLKGLIGQKVVLDTAGPITYLGTLKEIRPDGFWLEDADFRDRNEGHDSKEEYICEARDKGIRANRGRIFVFAHAVISTSALEDVIIG